MRSPAEAPSSNRRLALALLCALAGCLNPRPEEYPSDTTSPGSGNAEAPADSSPSRQGPDLNVSSGDDDPGGEPDSDQPLLPTGAPEPSEPGSAADAGVDAGVVDAGAPAVSE